MNVEPCNNGLQVLARLRRLDSGMLVERERCAVENGRALFQAIVGSCKTAVAQQNFQPPPPCRVILQGIAQHGG